jgi:hypothetical protein
MLPKVKFSMLPDGDGVEYQIVSKSLTAALRRATLLVEALGTRREIEIAHSVRRTKRNKKKHVVSIFVGNYHLTSQTKSDRLV